MRLIDAGSFWSFRTYSFDRVNHDRLVTRLKSHIADSTLLRLINRYLKVGVRAGEHTEATTMGVPQGGPLTPA